MYVTDQPSCVPGNSPQYAGLVHAAVPEHAVATGGSIGACGGGDALPTRPVQVQDVGLTGCSMWGVHKCLCVFIQVVSLICRHVEPLFQDFRTRVFFNVTLEVGEVGWLESVSLFVLSYPVFMQLFPCPLMFRPMLNDWGCLF